MKRSVLFLILLLPLIALPQIGARYEFYLKNNSLTPTDKSGLGIGTTCVNMSLVLGKIDNALYGATGGSVPRITVATHSLDTTYQNCITFFCWYQPFLSNATQQIYFSAYNTSTKWGFSIQRTSTDTLRVGICTSLALGTSTTFDYDSFFTNLSGKWVQIAIVLKGSLTTTGYIKVYRNGIPFASTTGTRLIIGSASGIYKSIACKTAPSSSLRLEGALDNLFIVNYEMSAQEIKTRYMSDQGIIYKWNFGGGKFYV